MLALAHHYDEPVAARGMTYRARVYSGAQPDGRWGAWIVFFPVGGGRVIATDRETTQSSLEQLAYWASGLTHMYLHGALERALALQPEEQLERELTRLERLEASAELRAETLDAAASAARAEAGAVVRARERTEERFLATTADAAALDAEVHQAAAEALREQASAADAALRARKRKTVAKKKK